MGIFEEGPISKDQGVDVPQIKALYDRYKQIFYESLEIVSTSQKRETILSRLDVAADKLGKATVLVQKHSFLDDNEIVLMNEKLIQTSKNIFDSEGFE